MENATPAHAARRQRGIRAAKTKKLFASAARIPSHGDIRLFAKFARFRATLGFEISRLIRRGTMPSWIAIHRAKRAQIAPGAAERWPSSTSRPNVAVKKESARGALAKVCFWRHEASLVVAAAERAAFPFNSTRWARCEPMDSAIDQSIPMLIRLEVVQTARLARIPAFDSGRCAGRLRSVFTEMRKLSRKAAPDRGDGSSPMGLDLVVWAGCGRRARAFSWLQIWARWERAAHVAPGAWGFAHSGVVDEAMASPLKNLTPLAHARRRGALRR